MFYDLVRRNNKKNIKENELFFASLVTAIVAFYTVLAFQKQDIVKFLNSLDSSYLEILSSQVSNLYLITLFILFFYVY